MESLEELEARFELLPEGLEKLELALEISERCRGTARFIEQKPYLDHALAAAAAPGREAALAQAHRLMGVWCLNQLRLDEALEHGYQALNLFTSLGDLPAQSRVQANLGVFYTALSLPERALDCFLRALQLDPDNGAAAANAGQRYYERGEHGRALDFFNQALALAGRLGDKSLEAHVLKSLGATHVEMGDPAAAERCYRESVRIAETLGERQSVAHAWLGLCQVHLARGETEAGHDLAVAALETAEQLENSELKWFALMQLARAQEATGDAPGQVRTLRRCLQLQEQMHSGRITQRIAELEATYQLERKELETRRLLEQQSRLASIGVMAAGITHEINQPLNAIMINADGLLYKDDRERVLPESYRESVRQIHEAACRVDEIVKHMRSFWSSPGHLARHELELSGTIQSALDLIRSQLGSHGVVLRVDWHPAPILVRAVRVHLEQIVINLAVNAMHALDQATGERVLEIGTAIRGSCAILTVRDTGAGLPPGLQDQLYDPFYSTRKAGEGMGLGLAIVKHFVEEMGGQVGHGNHEQGGAVFTISLPLAGSAT